MKTSQKAAIATLVFTIAAFIICITFYITLVVKPSLGDTIKGLCWFFGLSSLVALFAVLVAYDV